MSPEVLLNSSLSHDLVMGGISHGGPRQSGKEFLSSHRTSRGGSLNLKVERNSRGRDTIPKDPDDPIHSRYNGFPSSQCRGGGPHLELRPEPQVSSPVLTWISGFLWSFQGSQASSRVEICKSPFVSSFNSSVRLPAELTQGSVSFSQGATGLSHWPWCFESILRVTVESVQWNQFYQGWTGTWGSFGMVK